ncbi:MAG: glycosyltransferase family 2 protein [Prevotella sp.]|nr:glycosyltransferase family 2 protein [Prevotella sp.]
MEEKKNDKPVVSVIMPMHNSAKYLREAIESVRCQTFQDWELLVVDDASTDNSVEIAREYTKADSRIRLFVNESPIGIPSAPRNIGLQAAQGRFIAFLDSDDIYLPCKLEQQLALFEKEQAAVVYSNYEKMDEGGIRNNRIIVAPPFTDYKQMLKGNVITMPAGIYDRSKVGTVLMKSEHHEDYIMWLDILRQGFRAVNTQTVVAIVRVRDTSVSSNKLKAAGWQWNIYRNVEHIPLAKSVYYFVNYAYRAVKKSLV